MKYTKEQLIEMMDDDGDLVIHGEEEIEMLFLPENIRNLEIYDFSDLQLGQPSEISGRVVLKCSEATGTVRVQAEEVVIRDRLVLERVKIAEPPTALKCFALKYTECEFNEVPYQLVLQSGGIKLVIPETAAKAPKLPTTLILGGSLRIEYAGEDYLPMRLPSILSAREIDLSAAKEIEFRGNLIRTQRLDLSGNAWMEGRMFMNQRAVIGDYIASEVEHLIVRREPLVVEGTLDLSHTTVNDVPDLLYVGGDLILTGAKCYNRHGTGSVKIDLMPLLNAHTIYYVAGKIIV